MTTSEDVVHDGPAEEQPAAGEPSPDAAPAAEQSEPATVVPRPMIPIGHLVAHPGNVRRDLDITPEFVESFADGVLVPFRITPNGDGTYRVIDGGRRLAAAIKAGVTEVPYDLVEERAGDEAGQYLDMINANRHRNPLRPIEEADALFAAKEAGATRTRIRKTTGLTSGGLSNALAAAKLSEQARARVEDLDGQLTLDELAVLAEFDGDSDAIARLMLAASIGTLEHEAELLRQARAEDAEHERIRGELEAAGYAISEILPPNGQYLSVLHHDGADLTPETHAECPGRGVLFRSWDLLAPVHYCADPGEYGHTFRYAHKEHSATTADGPAGSRPGGCTPEPGDPDPGRRLVIQGNREWKAAAEVRRRWLVTHLFTRRTAPREAAQFVARQLLAMPDPLRSGLASAHSLASLSEVTGRDDRDWAEICDTAAAGRLPLVMLAPVVTAYEHAMSDGEGKNTWRADRYSPCPREQAAGYLRVLASIGYQMSAIEQAVADLAAYTGETPAGDPIIPGPDQPGPDGPEETGTDQDRADGPSAGDGDVPGEAAATGNESAEDQAAA